MEDDDISLLSDHDSIDPDRASLEAERQSLYGDTVASSDAQTHAMTPSSASNPLSPKGQEARRELAHQANDNVRDAGPAPPDYAAATADRQSHPTYAYMLPGEPRNYDTISRAAPRPSDHHVENPNYNQSQRPPVPEEQVGLITRFPGRRKVKRGCRGSCCGICCRFFLRLLVFLVGVLALLAIFGVFDNHHRTNITPPGEEGMALPIDGHGTNPHPSTPRCQYTTSSRSIQFDFKEPSSLSLIEHVDQGDRYWGHIGGYIWLVPASKQKNNAGQDAAIRVWTSIATTEPWSVSGLLYDKQDESLEIKFPSLAQEGNWREERPCMNIAMVVMFNEHVSLQSFNVSTTHLDVKVFDNLADTGLAIDRSNLDAIAGKVSLEYWSSRETRVGTVSGNVDGRFALRDLLQIQTVSGNIGVAVDPKKADPDRPAPARYIARSTSGDLRTTFPKSKDVPDRDYQVDVEGISSTISGTYLFQSSAKLKSTSGTMDFSLIPYDSSAQKVQVQSRSGDHNVAILSPCKDAGKAIQGLKSQHYSISGTMKIKYPQEWEGTLDGDTMSGSVKLEGKDLEGTDVGGGFLRKHFSARKGRGDSHIQIDTMSADVTARIGDV